MRSCDFCGEETGVSVCGRCGRDFCDKCGNRDVSGGWCNECKAGRGVAKIEAEPTPEPAEKSESKSEGEGEFTVCTRCGLVTGLDAPHQNPQECVDALRRVVAVNQIAWRNLLGIMTQLAVMVVDPQRMHETVGAMGDALDDAASCACLSKIVPPGPVLTDCEQPSIIIQEDG